MGDSPKLAFMIPYCQDLIKWQYKSKKVFLLLIVVSDKTSSGDCKLSWKALKNGSKNDPSFSYYCHVYRLEGSGSKILLLRRECCLWSS